MRGQKEPNYGVDKLLLFTKISYIIETFCKVDEAMGMTLDGKKIPINIVHFHTVDDRSLKLVEETVKMGEPLLENYPNVENLEDLQKFELLANMDKSINCPYVFVTMERYKEMTKGLTK